jgi:copper/silver efflux system protein
MIGGMVSSTLLTLIVIPAIYAVVKGAAIRSPRLAWGYSGDYLR